MLSAAEKALISSIWQKAAPNSDQLGFEALERMLTVFPQTKTYFKHMDLSVGSADIHKHGAKVIQAIGEAALDIDNMASSLSKLSSLHAYNLRVDPVNFSFLSQSVLVVLAIHLSEDFTPEAHAAFDKFLAAVAAILSEKYR
ncbi:hemoglobin subunit alpha-D-like [Polypterus senegalus]